MLPQYIALFYFTVSGATTCALFVKLLILQCLLFSFINYTANIRIWEMRAKTDSEKYATKLIQQGSEALV